MRQHREWWAVLLCGVRHSGSRETAERLPGVGASDATQPSMHPRLQASAGMWEAAECVGAAAVPPPALDASVFVSTGQSCGFDPYYRKYTCNVGGTRSGCGVGISGAGVPLMCIEL